MINSEIRRTPVYVGDGNVRRYSFAFKLFKSDEVAVFVADAAGKNERQMLTSEYDVAISPRQGEAPGGTVTLKQALPQGHKLVILSSVKFLQPFGLNNYGDYNPEDQNDAWDRNAILCQQLKDKLDRTIRLDETSEATPKELLNTILSTAADANKYAQEAEKLLTQSKQVATYVSEVKSSIDLSKQSIDASEASIAKMKGEIFEYADDLVLVSSNIANVNMVANNKAVIDTLAADLQGYPIYEFDGGEITEPNQSMNGVGGVMKICADNIDAIRRAAESLGNTETLTTLAEQVNEIGSTDYATIAESGNSGEQGV